MAERCRILTLAGIILVNGIILSKINMKIADFMEASKIKNTVVKVPSAIYPLCSLRALVAEEYFGLSKINFAAIFCCTWTSLIS